MLNYALTHSIRETAKLFKVNPNTVYLLKQRWIKTGSISVLKRNSYPERIITQKGESYIESVITLERLRVVYEENKGTMSNTLKRLNLTCKKTVPKKTKEDTCKKEIIS